MKQVIDRGPQCRHHSLPGARDEGGDAKDESAGVPHPNRRRILAACVLILLLAFGLRLIGLTRESIWDDEGSAIFRASLPLAQVSDMVLRAGNAVRVDTNPPVYFLALAVWLRLTGSSTFAIRYLSAMAGCLTVAATFPLARRVGGAGVALVAFGLAALSPFYVYYSQEARMYAILAALASLYLYAFVRAREGGGVGRWALVAALGVLGLYTHYYTIFLFAAVGVWLLIELILVRWKPSTRRIPRPGSSPTTLLTSDPAPGARRTPPASTIEARRLLGYGLAHLVVLLLFVPWVIHNVNLLRQFTASDAAGTTLSDVLTRSLLAFSSGNGIEPGDANRLGALYPAMHLQAELLAVPFLIAFGLGIIWRRSGPGSRGYPMGGIAVLAVAPAIFLVAATGRHVDFTPRYLTVAAPAFLLLTAAGVVVALRHVRPAGIALILVLLGISAYAIWHGAVDPAYGRPDVRDAVSYLEANAAMNSAVVVNASYTFPTYLYYRRRGDPWLGLPAEHPPDPAVTAASLARLAATHDEVWVLSWGDYYSDPSGLVGRWLDEHAYPKASAGFVGDVRVVGYTTHPPTVADPHPARLVRQTLGDTFELIGYDPPRDAEPGRAATVTLYWQSLRPVAGDLMMFAQLHDETGKLWAQSDGRPLHGRFPTQRWIPYAAVAEVRTFSLPPEMPAGSYDLDVGWYDLKTMMRVGEDPSFVRLAIHVGH